MSKDTCVLILSSLSVVFATTGGSVSASIFISTAILIIAIKGKE